MSALPQALPLALGAAIYPPALLVLLLLMGAARPRGLVLAYYAGAALVTVGSGLIALALLDAAGLRRPQSASRSGWGECAAGVLLLGVALWAWGRRARAPGAHRAAGRVAVWAGRACASPGWAFALGAAMYLPSPLYLLAVKTVGDSDSGTVPAVVVCGATVLLFVEIPLVAMYVRPDAVIPALGRVHDWLIRNGWTITAAVALVAGTYALVHGLASVR